MLVYTEVPQMSSHLAKISGVKSHFPGCLAGKILYLRTIARLWPGFVNVQPRDSPPVTLIIRKDDSPDSMALEQSSNAISYREILLPRLDKDSR